MVELIVASLAVVAFIQLVKVVSPIVFPSWMKFVLLLAFSAGAATIADALTPANFIYIVGLTHVSHKVVRLLEALGDVQRLTALRAGARVINRR